MEIFKWSNFNWGREYVSFLPFFGLKCSESPSCLTRLTYPYRKQVILSDEPKTFACSSIPDFHWLICHASIPWGWKQRSPWFLCGSISWYTLFMLYRMFAHLLACWVKTLILHSSYVCRTSLISLRLALVANMSFCTVLKLRLFICSSLKRCHIWSWRVYHQFNCTVGNTPRDPSCAPSSSIFGLYFYFCSRPGHLRWQ